MKDVIGPLQPVDRSVVGWRAERSATSCGCLMLLLWCQGPDDTRITLDFYKVLEVDYDATDEIIRLNYRRLALLWHPDKHNGNSDVTAKFQEINEAYQVLSDPVKRIEYDLSGSYEIDKYTLREYLTRFKTMILTCNGLGINHSSMWTQQLLETERFDQ